MCAHLAACPACQLRVNEFRAVSGLLDELPQIEPSPAFDARVRARVHVAEQALADVEVDRGTRDILVTEELLNRAQIGPALEQMRRVRVAKLVRTDPPRRPVRHDATHVPW